MWVSHCTATFYVTRVSALRGLEAGHAAHADGELLRPGINKEGLGWAGLGWAVLGWAGLAGLHNTEHGARNWKL